MSAAYSGFCVCCTPGPAPWPTIHTCSAWSQPVGSPLIGLSGGPPARRLGARSCPLELFRGLFRELVRHEGPDLPIPEAVWAKGGVVSGKPTVQGTKKGLNDLGRYVHRMALTNSRLLSIADGQVCFRYQDSQDQRWKTMTLPAHELIRRFLPHGLPQGFPNVRYDG